ncbi:Retrovirus-related Pol polyprotein from transposon TNT 1-94 [Trichinella pseudospiralis]|uniref:Retrovirus-related Pol polyprotein from transposon TNT 1-94 n=1 Tax=Trichinella pseudospiralis TaxID=6337 RepID=A0A0V0XKI4_TRIPS|nr:Retrovirus-related Pol polyprotein from transposon TNT 1-94 [Trichinella pseudospiralis]
MTVYIDRFTGITDELEAIGKFLGNKTVGDGLLLQNNVQQLALPLPKDKSCAFQMGHILAKCPFFINDCRSSRNQKKSDKHLTASTNFTARCLLIQKKKTLIFDKYGWRIVDIAFKVLRQHILSTATQYNGLYQLNRRDHWAMAVQDVPDLWHRRLRHLNRGSMKLLQDGQATGIPSDAITKTNCVTCLKGKISGEKSHLSQTDNPKTPQQNGVAKKMNCTLVEKARTMLIDAKLSADLWAKQTRYKYDTNITKQIPHKGFGKVIPERSWSGRKPNLAQLKCFRCLAMVHDNSGQRKKWDLKFEERIFVGEVKYFKSQIPATQASNKESTNPLLNPLTGKETVMQWTS